VNGLHVVLQRSMLHYKKSNTFCDNYTAMQTQWAAASLKFILKRKRNFFLN